MASEFRAGDAMALDIGVGWLAHWSRTLDADEFKEQAAIFVRLNEVLVAAKMRPHEEPLDIAEKDVFETRVGSAQMLHAVRRLAAFVALRQRLPTPDERELTPTADPALTRFYKAHKTYCELVNDYPVLTRVLRFGRPGPRYAHLVWHSDAEGFYLPRDFREVVMDLSGIERGVGGMVGSSVRLLDECSELARLIGLPADIDMDAEELWEAGERPRTDGAPWEAFGPEAFCLVRLIHGCKESLRLNSVLAFG